MFEVKEPLTGTSFDFSDPGSLLAVVAGGTIGITMLAVMFVVGVNVVAPMILGFIPGTGSEVRLA